MRTTLVLTYALRDHRDTYCTTFHTVSTSGQGPDAFKRYDFRWATGIVTANTGLDPNTFDMVDIDHSA